MAIGLTDRAANEVRRIVEEQNLPDATSLRVGVKGGGCSGFSYTLGFDDQTRETDQREHHQPDGRTRTLIHDEPRDHTVGDARRRDSGVGRSLPGGTGGSARSA